MDKRGIPDVRVSIDAVVDHDGRGSTGEEKERAARAAAIVLFGRFFLIVALTAAAFLPSALVLVAAAWLGLASEPAVMDAHLSPALIAAAIALFVLDYMIRR